MRNGRAPLASSARRWSIFLTEETRAGAAACRPSPSWHKPLQLRVEDFTSEGTTKIDECALSLENEEDLPLAREKKVYNAQLLIQLMRQQRELLEQQKELLHRQGEMLEREIEALQGYVEAEEAEKNGLM